MVHQTGPPLPPHNCVMQTIRRIQRTRAGFALVFDLVACPICKQGKFVPRSAKKG